MPTFENKGFNQVTSQDDNQHSPTDQAPLNAPPLNAPPYYPPQPQLAPNYYHPNPEHQRRVIAPGPQTMGMVMDTRPTDWMIPAILACIFCFWPTGICAIMYASRASDSARYGDMMEAHRHAKNAKILTITSIVVGVLLIVVPTILVVILVETAPQTIGEAIDRAFNNGTINVDNIESYNDFN